MIIERKVEEIDLEKFYNHELTLIDFLGNSWAKGSEISEGFRASKFKTIKIEIPELEEK